ncbi:hypothetical protein EV44_g3745 [Erysiphe necator]|uniref:Uncharacterized protein n=1 Tax=Uncinula necator TaxID=52586 RepID=A0A0B1P3N5_UNCNE|nr:hypothetical protein EV44_g3745 [Erysiphe necator]
MVTSNFNPCLLITTDENPKFEFGVVGMQTDDTLIVSSNIKIHQKVQGLKLRTTDILASNQAQQYLEQRARGAYIASICQPEVSYDLSVAVQAQQSTNEKVAKLNARLQWQMNNPH